MFTIRSTENIVLLQYVTRIQARRMHNNNIMLLTYYRYWMDIMRLQQYTQTILQIVHDNMYLLCKNVLFKRSSCFSPTQQHKIKKCLEGFSIFILLYSCVLEVQQQQQCRAQVQCCSISSVNYSESGCVILYNNVRTKYKRFFKDTFQ